MAQGFQSVQPVVDSLAERLGRAVLVDDRELNALCWSSQQEVDPIRLSSILRNTLEPAAVDVAYRIAMTDSVVVTDEIPEIGMKSRVCAPLVHQGEHIGYLWVLDPERTLSDKQKKHVRAAADEIVAALSSDSRDSERRRTELIARLERGHDDESAADLTIHEHLPQDVHVVADLRKKAGDWVLPDGIAIRPVERTATGAASGAPVPLADLGEAVRRARIVRLAVKAGAHLHERTFDALGSWRLLLEAPAELAPEHLAPGVAVLFEPGHADLLKTAEALFDAGGNVSAATAALHVHRTTFYYRLGRINDLVGIDLQHEDDRTDLRNALRLRRIRALLQA